MFSGVLSFLGVFRTLGFLLSPTRRWPAHDEELAVLIPGYSSNTLCGGCKVFRIFEFMLGMGA